MEPADALGRHRPPVGQPVSRSADRGQPILLRDHGCDRRHEPLERRQHRLTLSGNPCAVDRRRQTGGATQWVPVARGHLLRVVGAPTIQQEDLVRSTAAGHRSINVPAVDDDGVRAGRDPQDVWKPASLPASTTRTASVRPSLGDPAGAAGDPARGRRGGDCGPLAAWTAEVPGASPTVPPLSGCAAARDAEPADDSPGNSSREPSKIAPKTAWRSWRQVCWKSEGSFRLPTVSSLLLLRVRSFIRRYGWDDCQGY